MICCFLTGVQVSLEQAYVLNRREARDLLDVLKYRVASLRRLVEQFSPLDDQDDLSNVPLTLRANFAPKKHRLVCKAVADALAPGFPEIKLFMEWPVYHSQARKTALQGLRIPPVNTGKSQPTKQSAKPALSDHENQHQP